LAASIPETTSLATTILPLLQQTISNGNDEGSLPALIYALASVAFSSSSLTSDDILPLLRFLSEIFESQGHSINQGDDDDIITASIEAYAILLSIIQSPEDIIPDSMPALVDSLSSASLQVRLSAGEAIALSYELSPLEDSDSDSPQQPESPPYDDLHHLTILLSSLSTQSTKKLSKNSRREQHSLFRDILRTVSEHRGLPTQKLRFAKNQELRINSWEKLLRLKHLRRIFTHGLHVHLASNIHVREALDLAPVFDVEGSSEEEEVSSVERRTLQKEVKRLRKGKIRQDRRRAGEGRMIDVFGQDEDGEI